MYVIDSRCTIQLLCSSVYLKPARRWLASGWVVAFSEAAVGVVGWLHSMRQQLRG